MRLIFLLLGFISSLASNCQQLSQIESIIADYIKKDVLSQYNINKDTLTFLKANRLIGFDFSVFGVDFYAKEYKHLDSLLYFNLTKDEKNIIHRILDSLEAESKKFNELCHLDLQPRLDLTKKGDVYFFFSKECNNYIYVEAVPGPPALVLFGDEYEIYGEAHEYLFKIINNKIEAVYKGTIAYN